MSKILTTRQVAELTGFSMPKVQGLIRSGKIPAVNTSRGDAKPRWCIRLQDLDAYLTPDNIRQAQAMAGNRSRPARIDAHVKNKVFS